MIFTGHRVGMWASLRAIIQPATLSVCALSTWISIVIVFFLGAVSTFYETPVLWPSHEKR